ncbi:MAG: BatA domain-containing protein [Gammaproteobacteria bacterium]|nr:BatA domain-containing protein [Gammaproteobacteria bacterium]MDD9958400.1 BatA domain-containing protein [Gammaproteobacteria bacterium]
MVFLTPLFLVGLLAALIPIAIHLIRREKPPKIMFSTIRFLKKTSKKLVLFQHLQQILLLLLRSAVIALLVMAFARPLINQSVARLLDADPQSAVILLDLSMSMQYEETFDAAKQQALDILDGMTAGDEVALVGFSDSAQLVRELTTDLDSIRSAIDEIPQAGFGATRYMPNLRLADQMLEESRFENRAVYLISDFQDVAMQSAEEGWKLAPGVAFTGVDVGAEESSNLVLTDVRSPEQLLEDAAEQQILARVRTTGTLYLDAGEVSLSIDGQMVDRQPVNLDDRSEEVITFSTVFESEGTHIGEVRVEGDNFDVDNSYFFTVEVLPKIRVLVVNGESSDNWFDDEGHWFGLAVSSGEESPFELETIEPGEVSAAALRQSDVAVLLNVGGLSSNQAAAITDYVESGGALLVAPGDRVEPALFNQQFEAIAPAVLENQDTNGDDYLVIADFDRRHPILRPLDSDWSARFEGHWRLLPNADADVLMQFDNTEPALVEREVGEGKVILFASTMDLEWNNLPLQGLFLPFVHETLRHLVQPASTQRSFQVGDNFSLDPGGEASVIAAQDANGNAIEFTNDGFVIQAATPGFIAADIDGEAARFAVNILPEESNFARTPVENLYDAIINPDTNPIRSREVQTAQLIEELERPQRIWWWLLTLVMVLIVAESLIANRTYR